MYGATSGAAHHASVMEAVKAIGSVITVDPGTFSEILIRTESPLVIWAQGGLFSKHFKYLTPYRGLTFACQSKTPLDLPVKAEIVAAKRIAVPDL